MPMIPMLNEFNQLINVNVSNKRLSKLSKNKRRKLKKGYAVLTVKDVKINKPDKFTATFKSSGKIQPEYFEHFDSHNICRNSQTILINLGY